jgi:hypothetical protein
VSLANEMEGGEMRDTEQEHVDVERLMQEIRRQILEKRAAAGDDAAARVPVSGRRFSPEFYEHLYLAGLAYGELPVQAVVEESRVPLVGPLLARVKWAAHRLVIFYVNQVAERQVAINRHLLQALSLMSEELEQEAGSDDAG